MSGNYFNTVIALDYIWIYSHFLQQQLFSCEAAARQGHYFLSVLTQINLLEDAIKSAVDNYDDNYNEVAAEAFERGLLTEIEYYFVSGAENSLRKFRNSIAHKNLAAMYIQFSNEGLLCPLTEDETYQIFYNKYSHIIVNLILKVITKNREYNLCLDSLLKDNAYRIHTFTISELLALKGYPKDYADGVPLSDSDKIRLIDNSSDLTIINAILKSVLSVDKND